MASCLTDAPRWASHQTPSGSQGEQNPGESSPTLLVIDNKDKMQSVKEIVHNMDTDGPPTLNISLGWEQAIQSLNGTVTKKFTVAQQQAELIQLTQQVETSENMVGLRDSFLTRRTFKHRLAQPCHVLCHGETSLL